MVITKHSAESTEDESIFWGKIEVEVETREEWEKLLSSLYRLDEVGECDTVCRCNVKENAERIAQILDYDNLNKVAPLVSMEQESK